jgi:uncharacterized coiled-coil protein SlyX
MKDDHVAVLLESIEGNIAQLTDVMASMKQTLDRVDQRVEIMEPSVNLIPAVQSAVSEQQEELNQLSGRVDQLEATA